LKLLILLASLLLVLSLGLSYETIYADHSDSVILTTDKESYEYGETIIVGQQLLPPFISNATYSNDEPYETLSIVRYCDLTTTGGCGYVLGDINSTGYITLEIPLILDIYENGLFYLTGDFVTYHQTIVNPSNLIIDYHVDDTEYYLNLNTDLYTATAQNLRDIPAVNSTAQNNTVSITYLDSELSFMHNNFTIIESQIYETNSTITFLNNTITDLRVDLDALLVIVQDLLSQIPLPPPEIIAITANDPDDLDEIYSTDDTITIQFDSDTNEPGGTGNQQRTEVDDLFTFTESLGQQYIGIWSAPDTFTITIRNANNAGPPVIGNSTITPAQITLILPTDNNPQNFSSLTSPILTGDWGIIP